MRIWRVTTIIFALVVAGIIGGFIRYATNDSKLVATDIKRSSFEDKSLSSPAFIYLKRSQENQINHEVMVLENLDEGSGKKIASIPFTIALTGEEFGGVDDRNERWLSLDKRNHLFFVPATNFKEIQRLDLETGSIELIFTASQNSFIRDFVVSDDGSWIGVDEWQKILTKDRRIVSGERNFILVDVAQRERTVIVPKVSPIDSRKPSSSLLRFCNDSKRLALISPKEDNGVFNFFISFYNISGKTFSEPILQSKQRHIYYSNSHSELSGTISPDCGKIVSFEAIDPMSSTGVATLHKQRVSIIDNATGSSQDLFDSGSASDSAFFYFSNDGKQIIFYYITPNNSSTSSDAKLGVFDISQGKTSYYGLVQDLGIGIPPIPLDHLHNNDFIYEIFDYQSTVTSLNLFNFSSRMRKTLDSETPTASQEKAWEDYNKKVYEAFQNIKNEQDLENFESLQLFGGTVASCQNNIKNLDTSDWLFLKQKSIECLLKADAFRFINKTPTILPVGWWVKS